MATAIKNERHQAAADQKREQHATCYGDIAIKWNWLTAETDPGGNREPDRQSQKREQRHNDKKFAHCRHIRRRGILVMGLGNEKQKSGCSALGGLRLSAGFREFSILGSLSPEGCFVVGRFGGWNGHIIERCPPPQCRPQGGYFALQARIVLARSF